MQRDIGLCDDDVGDSKLALYRALELSVFLLDGTRTQEGERNIKCI